MQSAEERYEAAVSGQVGGTDHHDAAFERELYEQGALRRRRQERLARREAARGGAT